MSIRGVRGAIQVEADTPEAITRATKALLSEIMDLNPSLLPEDLASVFFTMTADLRATYPALAARELPGWGTVPLLCGREIDVPSGMPRCLRVLLHWNTELAQQEVRHAYLGAAARLRPDLSGIPEAEVVAQEWGRRGLQAHPPSSNHGGANKGGLR